MYSASTSDRQQDVAQEGANPFLEFYNLGYRRLVPVIPPKAALRPESAYWRALQKGTDSRGKAPGVKTAEGWTGLRAWQKSTTTPVDIANWHAMGASAGIRTGDGLVLIDADTLDEDHAKTIAEIVERHFGPLPCRVGRAPKAGYPIRVSASVPYSAIAFGQRNEKGLRDKVEILSDGKQFVAHGLHPQTGRPYTWPRPLVPYSDLPVVTPDQLDAFLDDLRHTLPAATAEKAGLADVANPASLLGSPERVRKAVEALPNTPAHFESRESYIAVGQAIRGALPDDLDEGMDIFLDFAERWAPHDPHGRSEDDLRTLAEIDWRKMQPTRSLGAPWLYEMAEKITKIPAWFDSEAAVRAETLEARDRAEKSPKTFLETSRFQRVGIATLADSALESDGEPLIDGLLDQGAMSVLYGDSNVGKSFVALRISWSVAAGDPWAGRAVKRGRVVYIAAEGGRGIAKRVAALRAKLGTAADDWFSLIVSPVNLLDPKADLAAIVARLKEDGGAALVVIDTLSRALAGGDENSSVDMGDLVKNLDAIRAATSAHLMVVHHSGKDRARGARGHSLLRAATDTEIEVASGVIEATKQRDIEERAKLGFGLESVTLGVSSKGRVVTSAVCVADGSKPVVRSVSDVEVVEALRGQLWRRAPSADGSRYVGEAVAAVSDLHPFEDRKAIDERVSHLVRSGLLQVVEMRDPLSTNRRKVPFVGPVLDKMSENDAFA